MALVAKNLPAIARDSRDTGSIPRWEDPLEKEMVTYSSILAWENPMDSGTWRATVHGVTKESDTTERLS